MGKQAKIDPAAAAETMKNEIKATADAGINQTLNTLVTTFSERDADTEAAFLNLVGTVDKETCQKVLDELDISRACDSRVSAYAHLLPEYRRLRVQIAEAEHAKKQLELATKYPTD